MLVNLHDYLDTGLFLDHRLLRTWLWRESSGGHFLNLFSYTGVATLHAALGGATTSTSVDSSATYLDWFNANLALNGLSNASTGASVPMLGLAVRGNPHYDLIMVDPPSFSNSKGQADLRQRDHLLAAAGDGSAQRRGCSTFHQPSQICIDPAVEQTWQ